MSGMKNNGSGHCAGLAQAISGLSLNCCSVHHYIPRPVADFTRRRRRRLRLAKLAPVAPDGLAASLLLTTGGDPRQPPLGIRPEGRE
jgi:hypothetical protein